MHSDDVQLRVSAQIALLGEVTPNMRCVSCEMTGNKITVKFVFDGEISEADIERAGEIGTEIVAAFSGCVFIEEQVVRLDRPLSLQDTWLRLVAYERFEVSGKFGSGIEIVGLSPRVGKSKYNNQR